MKEVKIGIISDTHGLLREEVLENLRVCEYIFHAGDIGSEEIVNKLNEISKLIVVKGNNDKESWADKIKENEVIEIDGFKIYMVHNKKDIPKEDSSIDMFIYGHSHSFSTDIKEGAIYFNPGSCGKKRFSLPLTMSIAYLKNKKIRIEKIEIMA